MVLNMIVFAAASGLLVAEKIPVPQVSPYNPSTAV